MKTEVILVTVYIVVSFSLGAQFKPRQITINLTPIVIENGKYHYESKRLSFDALMLPLHSLEDMQINSNVKTAQTLRDLSKITYMGVMVYFIFATHDQQASISFLRYEANRNIVIGAFVTMGILYFIEKSFERKAIRRYNSILLMPEAFLPGNAFGARLTIRI